MHKVCISGIRKNVTELTAAGTAPEFNRIPYCKSINFELFIDELIMVGVENRLPLSMQMYKKIGFTIICLGKQMQITDNDLTDTF